MRLALIVLVALAIGLPICRGESPAMGGGAPVAEEVIAAMATKARLWAEEERNARARFEAAFAEKLELLKNRPIRYIYQGEYHDENGMNKFLAPVRTIFAPDLIALTIWDSNPNGSYHTRRIGEALQLILIAAKMIDEVAGVLEVVPLTTGASPEIARQILIAAKNSGRI